jgi:BirA family biotin operon repressor/biotin-[acetyl-CoA-carboxylase] ligase
MHGRTIHYGLVDSTNERALHALHEGQAAHGDVHLAEGQTAGRGRLGREWVSDPGLGVYLSLVVRPGCLPPPGALTLAGGLAVLDSCRASGLERAELDWPNDVVVGSAKLAGVLTESRGLDPGDPAWVVGVGLNVAQRDFSPALEGTRAVTSFLREGVAVAPGIVEERLVLALRRRVTEALQRPEALFEEAFGALLQRDREVRVECAGEAVEGKFTALHPQRGLCIDREHGRAWLPLAHVRSVELLDAVG